MEIKFLPSLFGCWAKELSQQSPGLSLLLQCFSVVLWDSPVSVTAVKSLKPRDGHQPALCIGLVQMWLPGSVTDSLVLLPFWTTDTQGLLQLLLSFYWSYHIFIIDEINQLCCLNGVIPSFLNLRRQSLRTLNNKSNGQGRDETSYFLTFGSVCHLFSFIASKHGF